MLGRTLVSDFVHSTHQVPLEAVPAEMRLHLVASRGAELLFDVLVLHSLLILISG